MRNYTEASHLIIRFLHKLRKEGVIAAAAAVRHRLAVNWEERISRFEFKDNSQIRAEIIRKFDYDGPLLPLFSENRGQLVHKWHHYIPIYDRYFSLIKRPRIRLLEIGVSDGGSLKMWRKFLGNEAIIFGIDINPSCARLDGIHGQVRIGSQTDPVFLQSVIKEMGGIDIVLDDGSHHMNHIPETLRILFPLLEIGGIYMIEDLHTSYWKEFGGGYNSSNNFFNYVRLLINDMHAWYHDIAVKQAEVSKYCSGIHIHDSVVVIEKNLVHQPVHSRVS